MNDKKLFQISLSRWRRYVDNKSKQTFQLPLHNNNRPARLPCKIHEYKKCNIEIKKKQPEETAMGEDIVAGLGEGQPKIKKDKEIK